MTRNFFLVGSLLAASLIVSAPSALAACQTTPVRFFPSQNDTVSTTATVSGGVCEITYHSSGAFQFTSTIVVSRPQHGIIVRTGVAGIRYRVAKGFRGTDHASVKFCGKGRTGSGCSTVNFNFNDP